MWTGSISTSYCHCVYKSVDYHDAAGLVVVDGCLQFEVLPPDDGVGHGELEEERLEDGDLLTRSQAKTLRGQTESLRLPGGDGVWDSEGHIRCSRLSGSADTQHINTYCEFEEHTVTISLVKENTRPHVGTFSNFKPPAFFPWGTNSDSVNLLNSTNLL